MREIPALRKSSRDVIHVLSSKSGVQPREFPLGRNAKAVTKRSMRCSTVGFISRLSQSQFAAINASSSCSSAETLSSPVK
jgi:hypothetical protein